MKYYASLTGPFLGLYFPLPDMLDTGGSCLGVKRVPY